MSTIETDSTMETAAARTVDDDPLRAQRELEDEDTDTIERHIDATRADMRATLEALERRFSFDRLVDLTVGRIRDRGGEFAGNLTEAAAQNPVPLLLASIGIGWMMLASRKEGSTRSYTGEGGRLGDRMRGARERVSSAADQVRGTAESTRDTLRSAAETSRDALRSAAESSRETLEHTAESLRSGADALRGGATRAAEATREQIEHARSRVDRMLDEQPLMLGALGLAAGALIGALLPTTEHEGRFLGEARDKVVKDVAQKSRVRYDAARENARSRSAPENRSAASEVSGAREEQPASRPH